MVREIAVNEGDLKAVQHDVNYIGQRMDAMESDQKANSASINAMEKAVVKLTVLAEQQQEDRKIYMEEMHNISEKFDNTVKDISNKFEGTVKDMGGRFDTVVEKLTIRVRNVERWGYKALGGIALIGFLTPIVLYILKH